MPFSLLNERSLAQSSGVTRRGGERGKVGWLVHRLFAPKRPSRVRGILVCIKLALEPDRRSQPAPGKTFTRKKRERNLKIENPSKISITKNIFLLQILNFGKLYVLKKMRNCKGSVSSIVKFIEWKLLHASVRQLSHFYSSKRKRKKEKRERRKRTVERHFRFDVFLLA